MATHFVSVPTRVTFLNITSANVSRQRYRISVGTLDMAERSRFAKQFSTSVYIVLVKPVDYMISVRGSSRTISSLCSLGIHFLRINCPIVRYHQSFIYKRFENNIENIVRRCYAARRIEILLQSSCNMTWSSITFNAILILMSPVLYTSDPYAGSF